MPTADPVAHAASARMTADTLVIVNPASAGGRTGKRWPTTADQLAAAGVDVDVHFTTQPREATARTRQALEAGYRRVVGVGGDGTLNELVNGYFGADGSAIAPNASLGLIPSGTGGDFRRTARLLTAREAIAALVADQTRRIDVGRIDSQQPGVHGQTRHWFLNIADWGVGGDVVARVNNSRFKAGGARGTAVFLGISLQQLLTYGLRGVRVSLDDREIDRDVSNVVVANGRCFGGGMRIAPKAQLADGLFDVVLIGRMSRVQTFANIPRLYRGTHIGRPGIEHFRARVVRVEPTGPEALNFEAEGEFIGAGAATITCIPDAVSFVM